MSKMVSSSASEYTTCHLPIAPVAQPLERTSVPCALFCLSQNFLQGLWHAETRKVIYSQGQLVFASRHEALRKPRACGQFSLATTRLHFRAVLRSELSPPSSFRCTTPSSPDLGPVALLNFTDSGTQFVRGRVIAGELESNIQGAAACKSSTMNLDLDGFGPG